MSFPDFSLWKRISEEESSMMESRRRQVLRDVWNVLHRMSDKYSWEALYIFGSLIREGGFSKRSDVDIGVRGLDKLRHYKFTGDISIILNRDVDVVRIEECSFAETIISRGIKWTKEKSLSF